MNEQLLEALREVLDPEIGINVVDLGLVYRAEVEGKTAHIAMTMTTPACPLHEYISEAAKTVVLHVDASSFRHQVGAEQTRDITSLTADELIYQSPMLSGGQSYVTMKRAK